jgi:hypothetical protein
MVAAKTMIRKSPTASRAIQRRTPLISAASGDHSGSTFSRLVQAI